MTKHDRFAAHELIHRYWFSYDEGHFDLLTTMLATDCRVRSRTERGDHPHEAFIASDNHGRDAVMAWTTEHRRFSPYPLRHQASNIHVVAERGDEVDIESYLFVTQILDRVPSALSTGIVHFTLRVTETGYVIVNKDVVLDSIQSAAFETIPEVRDRMERW
jgi:3-phenylpropionate/cinnamic acid dioxygenase small subunit